MLGNKLQTTNYSKQKTVTMNKYLLGLLLSQTRNVGRTDLTEDRIPSAYRHCVLHLKIPDNTTTWTAVSQKLWAIDEIYTDFYELQ